MTPKRKQRLMLVIALLTGIGLATVLVLKALKENINLFFSPTQVAKGQAPQDTSFRLGGMVVDGSVSRAAPLRGASAPLRGASAPLRGASDDDLTVIFELTDTAEKVSVNYKGILPDLFREGQGIVTQGKLDESGTFIASEVLAKHDENYMPPEVSDAVNKAMKNNMAQ